MPTRFWIVFWVTLGAFNCATTSATPTMTPVATEVVEDGGAQLAIELSYQLAAPRQATLLLDLNVGQFEQTDRLESNVFIQGFNVIDGSLRWAGFVAPRQPEKHRVTIEMPAGVDEGAVTVTLQSTAHSKTLFRRELVFAVADDGMLEVSEGE